MAGIQNTAVIIGATGLVGTALVQKLLADESFSEIKLLVRKSTKINHPKIKEYIIDFNNTNDYDRYITGDVLFSCLGTTLSTAGSKENQYLVDYTYQYQAAKSGAENGVKCYILVSSPYAKIDSGNYYRKMKAELEDSISVLDFEKIVILKPNVLSGERKTPRVGESIAVAIIQTLGRLLPFLKKYRPISGKNVAQAMLNSFYYSKRNPSRINIFKRIDVENIGKLSENSNNSFFTIY
ncbi:NAD(P)H-binding protein [Dysgonomonas capnocytophagoides]|uniref:NAD(P)H-binding protein n=1 Tax=Dysgonomonas capnocytophagoides TaxID=45254 RepID=UPI00291F27FF|nr:oxidoreductase [Dysgonomonas capnocytophagoides]